MLPRPDPLDDESDEPIHWWRPDWTTVLKSVGTAWFVLLALMGAVLLLAAWGTLLPVDIALRLLFMKLAFLIGACMIALSLYLFRLAMRARRDPFCIFCGYNLSGLPDNHRCPECGRSYTFAMIEQYREDPAWFAARWKARQQLPPPDPTLQIPDDAHRSPPADGTQ